MPSAVEATADGFRWTFAPMVDIARDARWGRGVEGAGEDVYLGRQFAAARVRGFQGKDLARADAMLATPKHFAGYGAAEGGLDYNAVDLSERTLREVYLPPFRAAIDAGALSIMSAFNEIGGIPVERQPRAADRRAARRMGLPGLRRLRLHRRRGAHRARLRGRRARGRQARLPRRHRRQHAERPVHAAPARRWWPRARCRCRGSTTRCAACCASSMRLGLFDHPFRGLEDTPPARASTRRRTRRWRAMPPAARS